MSVNQYVNHARDYHGQRNATNGAFMLPASRWASSKQRETQASERHIARNHPNLGRVSSRKLSRRERAAYLAARKRDQGAKLTPNDYRRTPSVKPAQTSIRYTVNADGSATKPNHDPVAHSARLAAVDALNLRYAPIDAK